MLKVFYTDKAGNVCAAKAQNSITWLIALVKVLLGGVTVAGFTFDTVTMESMSPILALLAATQAGYQVRNWSKEKHRAASPSSAPWGNMERKGHDGAK